MAWAAKPTGKRGRQPLYSDAAVQTCLTMKLLFGMALRQTTGFVESLLYLIGLGWDVPDFSTLSRRQKTLAVNIPHRGGAGPAASLDRHRAGKRHRFKRTGEGGSRSRVKENGVRRIRKQSGGLFSRRTRKHGGTKRRVWRKVHLGIDEQTLEIRAVEVTSSDVGDR